MSVLIRTQPYLAIPPKGDLITLIQTAQNYNVSHNSLSDVEKVISAIDNADIQIDGYNNPRNSEFPYVTINIRIKGVCELRKVVQITSLGNLSEHSSRRWIQVEGSVSINFEEGSGLVFCSSDPVFGDDLSNPFIKENGWLVISHEQEKRFKTAISDLDSKIRKKYLKEISNIIKGVLHTLEDIISL